MRFPHSKTIQIVGQRNSGKTRLMQYLIAAFTQRGLKAGAFKHSGHPHALDKPGSDSDKYATAGGVPSAFMTPDGLSLTLHIPESNTLHPLVEAAYRDCDLVFVESFHALEGPRILVGDIWERLTFPEQVIAQVAAGKPNPVWPQFGHDDSRLLPFLMDYLSLSY